LGYKQIIDSNENSISHEVHDRRNDNRKIEKNENIIAIKVSPLSSTATNFLWTIVEDGVVWREEICCSSGFEDYELRNTRQHETL